jgi:hypothetical protein
MAYGNPCVLDFKLEKHSLKERYSKKKIIKIIFALSEKHEDVLPKMRTSGLSIQRADALPGQ